MERFNKRIQQDVFLLRLQQVVTWTELLMKDVSRDGWGNRTIFRKTNPFIDGVRAFQLQEEGVIWSRDIWDEDFILRVLVEVLPARESVQPASWEDIIQKGRIVAHETCTTVVDGASEEQSGWYVDLYDLPPVDTWIYLTPQTRTAYPTLYCWVPTIFEEAMQTAMDVHVLDSYEWVDIAELLPDYL
ncbi:hypothetical protein HHL17_23200 [Chitinophaga sp. G-6-1-13]|uniref:Uncharacterized protein n=1 Tax=Chitinophaga fulva TaxID=2728842 RepID=A0A848GND1_9BACT|nr:hypothetical protein [Chitinophaga fulva]NML40125.1 hypothetical protein [Chitinophaga fulva]